MPAFILSSFAKGELAPALHGRVDTAAYQVGLRTARNLIIHTTGGASNRPGSVFVGPCGNHTDTSRLFQFKFRTTDQYVLVFGALTMRVIRNEAFVTNATVSITNITSTHPPVVTANSHGFANGTDVFITGVSGITEVNGNIYTVASQTTNTFELTSQITGANTDGRRFGTFSGSGGTCATIFELTTPYAQGDLSTLKATQSGDLMTITHASYAARDLARTGHNAWTLTVSTFAPALAAPTGVAVAQQGTSGSTTHRYRITAIQQEEDVFEESLPGLNNTSKTVASATAANPVVCTASSHGYVDGDEIELSAFDEMTEVNGRRFFVASKTTNTFELEGEDGSSYTAESTGGIANATFVALTDSITVALTTLADFNRITWTQVTAADRYAIYRQESGRYGLIAEIDAKTGTFDDVTTAIDEAGVIHAVDSSITPPRARNPFLFAGTYPGASSYYQQRQVYGGSLNAPDTAFYSQTGNRLNMSVSTPTKADDAMTFALDATQVSEIRHFVPLTDLLIMTDSGEWRINAGDNSGFSAATLQQKPQSRHGSSHNQPLIIGDSVLFVEAGGVRIRTLNYDATTDKYRSDDLMLLSTHLLGEEGVADFIVTDWDAASVPEPRLYVVRSDGQILVLTYDRVQEVIAWTHWDTDGSYEAVVTLQRSVLTVEDGVYFIVQRTIDGQTVRYVERLSTRKFADVRDAFFVDSGLSLDADVTITGSTKANPVVITAASHGFSNGNVVDLEKIVWEPNVDEFFTQTQPDQLNNKRFIVGNQATNTFELLAEAFVDVEGATQANPVVISAIAHGFVDGQRVHIDGMLGMTALNGNSFLLQNVTDDTFELIGENGLAYNAWTAGGKARGQIDSTNFNAYVSDGKVRKAVTRLSGLEHLEGEDVAILADGNPIASVSIADATAANPTTIVVDASITLGTAASRIHIGKQYVSDLETLNVESSQGTVQGKLGKISELIIRFYKSRMPLVGSDAGNLVPIKQREEEKLGEATRLLSGDEVVYIPPEWNTTGRVFFRQAEPLPTTWLAIIPEMIFEDRGDDD